MSDPVGLALAAFPPPPGGAIDLTLDRLAAVLERLGAPHRALPPVVHVAGTNGKGSTLAFLRAMLEAGGKRVHAFTSPHLLFWHETIRLAAVTPGRSGFISDRALLGLLEEVAIAAGSTPLSGFERVTAACFLAFAHTPADAVLLETGLGGEGDATNLVPHSAVTAITRLSHDHCDFLGTDIAGIARAKAGILRPGVPVVRHPQPDPAATRALDEACRRMGAPSVPWHLEFGPSSAPVYHGPRRTLTLPPLPLAGAHQVWNAGAALTCLDTLFPGAPFSDALFSDAVVKQGLAGAQWPGRLQPITTGPLPASLPPGSSLWLDGGHNDSAGEVLAAWLAPPGPPRLLVWGMLQRKAPLEFLAPLRLHLERLVAIPIPNAPCWQAEDLAALARGAGVAKAASAETIPAALACLQGETQPWRVLIAGSLGLVGETLALDRSLSGRLG